MKKQLRGSTALVPCPVILLSVKGAPTPNIITLSWAANICSDPPSVAVGIRATRHSYDLVKRAGEFVVNIPRADQLDAAEFCGSKSGARFNKFAECNLTPVPATKIDAPMIEECPINLECKTTEIIKVGVHDVFIAEILAVHIDDSLMDERGRFDASKANLFVYLPLNAEYWSLGEQLP
ncbi:MAG: flavin reductase family protein [Candidatus Thorarchaeota archaeon]